MLHVAVLFLAYRCVYGVLFLRMFNGQPGSGVDASSESPHARWWRVCAWFWYAGGRMGANKNSTSSQKLFGLSGAKPQLCVHLPQLPAKGKPPIAVCLLLSAVADARNPEGFSA